MNYYNTSSLAVKKRQQLRKKKKEVAKIQTSKATIISMVIGIVIMLVPISMYIGMKSNVSSNKIVISELNYEYDRMKLENDAYEHTLTSKVNLNDIYDKAINKLNMKKLTVDKIKYYKTNMGDYFKQNTNLTK